MAPGERIEASPCRFIQYNYFAEVISLLSNPIPLLNGYTRIPEVHFREGKINGFCCQATVSVDVSLLRLELWDRRS